MTCQASTSRLPCGGLQTLPGKPQNVQSSNAGIITFSPPASDGGSLITGYVIEIVPPGALPGDADNEIFTCAASPCTIPGYNPDGTHLDVFVRAENAVGQGPSALVSGVVRQAGDGIGWCMLGEMEA